MNAYKKYRTEASECLAELDEIHRKHPRVVGTMVSLDDNIENATEDVINRLAQSVNKMELYGDIDNVDVKKQLQFLHAIIHSERIEISRAREFITKWNRL